MFEAEMGEEDRRDATPQYQRCPQCGNTVPVNLGFVPWCEKCGWNIDPAQPEVGTRFDRYYASLGKRLGRQLFEDLHRTGDLPVRMTLSKVLALAVAAAVNLVTICCAGAGVAILIWGWPYPSAIVAAVLFLLLVWVTRPRFGRAPREALSPEACPILHEVVNRIARQLGLPGIDTIAVDGSFNASYAQYGWRQRRAVSLGLPLLTVLDAQEWVALIAHEVAHGVNGDYRRSFFVGTAINSLLAWYSMTYPEELLESDSGLMGLAMVPVRIAMRGVGLLIALAAFGLLHLTWRDSQRAEYLADRLAAQTAGTKAEVLVLEKATALDGTVRAAIRNAAIHGRNDLFPEIRRRAETIPTREWERVRRLQRRGYSALDSTHPPTAYRLELLLGHPVAQPALRIPPGDVTQLETELAALEPKIMDKLKDRYLASLWN